MMKTGICGSTHGIMSLRRAVVLQMGHCDRVHNVSRIQLLLQPSNSQIVINENFQGSLRYSVQAALSGIARYCLLLSDNLTFGRIRHVLAEVVAALQARSGRLQQTQAAPESSSDQIMVVCMNS